MNESRKPKARVEAITESRKPKLRMEDMREFEALTNNQQLAIEAYDKGYNIILDGSAGTGKTFLAMAMALEDVLDKNTPYERLVIVRSIVPTRDIGFLPGTEDEKKMVYEQPYHQICSEIFEAKDAYERLKESRQVEFVTTSFIRGLTIRNAIVVVDESQNCNWHELSSVATRIGENSKLLVCGDYKQSDLSKRDEKAGILQFLKIMELMSKCTTITFTWEDIVRSGFVREFIMTCEKENVSIT